MLASLVTNAKLKTLCALEITLVKTIRRRGLSGAVLVAMRSQACEDGLEGPVAPVRPTGKTSAHGIPMGEYANEVLSDGLSLDPWLRIQALLGAVMCNIAELSMVIADTFADWLKWTEIDIDATTESEVELPGGLAPVSVNRIKRMAAYVEPDVWCRHRCDSNPI